MRPTLGAKKLSLLSSQVRRHRAEAAPREIGCVGSCELDQVGDNRRCAFSLCLAAEIEPMDFLRQAVTAFILITLTLAMQSAGMGALIHWGRAQFRRELHRLGAFRYAELIVRCMSV